MRKPVDVRAEGARETLLELALQPRSCLGYDLKKHPQRGEAIRMLEEVGRPEGVWYPKVIAVMAEALPDSPRTVGHFLDAVAEQQTWQGVDELLSDCLRYFDALKLQVNEGLDKLYRAALASGGPVTLPLGRPLPPPSAPTGAVARLKGLFAKPAPPPPGRDRQEFTRKYLHPIERELESLRAKGATRPVGPGGTAATAPLRTRQQRIDELMEGGPLTDELFLVLTSREDGYTNLKRLIERRRETLVGLTRPRFGLKLDAAQFRELWAMLPADLQANFGVSLLYEARASLGREDALQLLRHPSAEVVKRVLYDLPNTGSSEDTALAQELIGRHPKLASELRRHFLSAIPPSRGEMPVWEKVFRAPDPFNVVLLPQHVLISTPVSIESLGAVTGVLEWGHNGDCPLLFHGLQPGRHLGERGSHVCLVEAGPGGVREVTVFSNQSFQFEAGDSVYTGQDALGIYRHDAYDGEHYTLEPKTGQLKYGSCSAHDRSESRLLSWRWRHSHNPVRCGPAQWVCHYERKGFYAFERADEPGGIDLTFTDNYMYGLESRGEERTLRCWVL